MNGTPNPAASVDAPLALPFDVGRSRRRATEQRRSAKYMKLRILVTLLSVPALLMSCSKEPSKDSPSTGGASEVKAILLEKLGSYQGKVDGLYAVSNGLLRIGGHSVDPMPVVESEGSKQGKSIVAMRLELVVDGASRPEAVFGAIGIADTRQEAIAVGLGEWYLGFALPFFQALGERKPSLVVADYDVFAGVLGLRGGKAQGWVDGSEAMNRKILEAVLSTGPWQGEVVTLDLKAMVPPAGQPQSECRISGAVSTETASQLIALDWPRTADGYIFKQAFVLKRKKPNPQHGANGRQPFGLETERTSAAAASRRSC